MHVDHASAVKKRDHQKFVGGFAVSGLLRSGRASILPLETLSLGLWVIAVDPACTAGHQSIKNSGIWIDQLDHLPAFMTTSFFLIFSEHTGIKLRTIDTRQSSSMEFFIWPINFGVLTSLLLPYLSSSLTDSLPSLNLLCHSKTDARFMQGGPKAVWSIPCFSVAFFLSLKQNFIAYCFFKVSSRPDCIFEIHQLWQSAFSRVYSNSCCSSSFKPEVIKIGQSSHKTYSNKILNFQESTTILNTSTKNVWKLIEGTNNIYLLYTTQPNRHENIPYNFFSWQTEFSCETKIQGFYNFFWNMKQSKPIIFNTELSLYMYIFLFKQRNYIANWITPTRKSGEHLHVTYGNAGQLFRPYSVSSAVFTVISPSVDRTSDCRAETLPLNQRSTSHTSDAKSTSHGNYAANSPEFVW